MIVSVLLSLLFLGLGAVAGSFAGVIAERSYTGQSWKAGRSRCNACARTLSSTDMVPILSWLFAHGRCRACHAHIPPGYLYIELALALSFMATYRLIGLALPLIPFLLALIVLAAIVMYDLRHMIVPPAFSAWLIAFSLVYALLAYPSLQTFGFVLMQAGAIGLVLFLFYALSGGRVMGLGDAPVALALSLLAGPLALAGLVFSFWVGGVIGIIVLLGRPRGHRMGIEVPFVPFMACGFLLATFLGWNPFPFIGL